VYIKYLSLTPHVESLVCVHVGDQEGPRFCTIEQDRHYQCLIQVYTLVLILRELHFHTLCREFITEQASPIPRSTSGHFQR